jgi:CopG family nickel-responsive transcriptional regulator
MDNVTRIGVSLEPELLKDFDQLIETKGYSSRSEAIRDMIRNALVDSILEDEDAEVVGTVTLIYEHHKGNVQENLMEIQHLHHANISSTIHIHLNLEQCLEVLVVWGRVREVKTIADALMSVRGVLHGKLTMTSGRVDSHPHQC